MGWGFSLGFQLYATFFKFVECCCCRCRRDTGKPASYAEQRAFSRELCGREPALPAFITSASPSKALVITRVFLFLDVFRIRINVSHCISLRARFRMSFNEISVHETASPYVALPSSFEIRVETSHQRGTREAERVALDLRSNTPQPEHAFPCANARCSHD